MNKTDFSKGLWVKIDDQIGVINFVSHSYVTICVNPESHKSRQVCILISQSEWNKIKLIKESEK
jgi:hypothetical protein